MKLCFCMKIHTNQLHVKIDLLFLCFAWKRLTKLSLSSWNLFNEPKCVLHVVTEGSSSSAQKPDIPLYYQMCLLQFISKTCMSWYSIFVYPLCPQNKLFLLRLPTYKLHMFPVYSVPFHAHIPIPFSHYIHSIRRQAGLQTVKVSPLCIISSFSLLLHRLSVLRSQTSLDLLLRSSLSVRYRISCQDRNHRV